MHRASATKVANSNDGKDRLRIPRGALWDHEFYLFYRLSGRAVAYNIFIEGNNAVSRHDIALKPFTYDADLGAVARFSHWQLTLTKTRRTREFRSQPAEHKFGSIDLSYVTRF